MESGQMSEFLGILVFMLLFICGILVISYAIRKKGPQETVKTNMPDRGNMTETQQKDVSLAYEAAVDHGIAEIHYRWTMYNTLIVANSIFFAATVLLLGEKIYSLAALLCLPCIFLCIYGFVMTARSFYYQKYWRLSACQIEEHLLSGFVRIYSHMRKLRQGTVIAFEIEDDLISVKMPSYLKPTSRGFSFLILGLFLLVYLCLGAYAINNLHIRL